MNCHAKKEGKANQRAKRTTTKKLNKETEKQQQQQMNFT